MKHGRRFLAAAMSLLLSLSSLAIPLGTAAASDDFILADFKYMPDKITEAGTDSKSGSSIRDGTHFYLNTPVDLTQHGASAPVEKGAAIIAPDIYLQADMQIDTHGNQVNLLFLQPHCASSLTNNAASAEEINALVAAGGWYTVSVPLSRLANNDGIDLTNIQWATYFVSASGSVDVQVKHMRIVKMTVAQIRTTLNALLTADQPAEEDYISVADYNTALAAAQTVYANATATGEALMTAWNVLQAAKDQLVPVPAGVDKTALQNALAESLPTDGEYDRTALAAYEQARAGGQTVLSNKGATQDEVDAAVQAIAAARAALADITYQVAQFPPVAGSDENGVYTWTFQNAANQSPFSYLEEAVDLSRHEASKLRFRVDIRLVEGDATGITQVLLQPGNKDRSNMENQYNDTAKTVLPDGEWHTFERDFSKSIGKYPDTWSLIELATMNIFNTAGNQVTLEIKNFRIVDITLEENKAELKKLMNTSVGDKDLYPEALWNTYQDALAAARQAMDEAVTNAAVWQAQDQLQAAMDALGKRGMLADAINEALDENKTYSDDSVAAYEAAKEAARQVLADSASTESDIDAALQAILDAKAALVETTFLVAEFPIPDQTGVVEGVYESHSTGHVNSPVGGVATQTVNLRQHDRSKLYMQFDILFEEGFDNAFHDFYIRPVYTDNTVQNHTATAAVNAVAKETGVWHTISTPLSTTISLENIYGMSFYMKSEDDTTIGVKVTNFRIVDLSSEPVLNSLFADGMMFQQNKPISVFGEGGAGTAVSVALYKDGTDAPVATQTVTVGDDGRWQADLLKDSGLKGGYDTYTLTVKGDTIAYTYRNILIGEVWVAGGQSNMEYRIKDDVNNTAILENTDENIRIFNIPVSYGGKDEQPLTPQFSTPHAIWFNSTDVDRLKGMSSVAYNFALKLREELDVPIGFLNTAVGGTYIEAWLSREAIENDETVRNYLQKYNRYYDDENWPNDYNRMSALYNQKIGGLSGYQVAGTIW